MDHICHTNICSWNLSAKNSIGQAEYSGRASIYYNGSREAGYIVFLNATTPTGEYQVSVYDVDN